MVVSTAPHLHLYLYLYLHHAKRGQGVCDGNCGRIIYDLRARMTHGHKRKENAQCSRSNDTSQRTHTQTREMIVGCILNQWCHNSRGGQERWAKIRAEAAKVEGKTESIAETAKTKVAGAVEEAKKTVS